MQTTNKYERTMIKAAAFMWLYTSQACAGIVPYVPTDFVPETVWIFHLLCLWPSCLTDFEDMFGYIEKKQGR